MMFLHNDKDLFRDVIAETASAQRRPVSIIEKDYYVTMILKLLSETAPNCVFKGGTSLEKCHHAIDRFSEDIDITFSRILTQGQRKDLKNNTIASISESLGLPISNWDEARSRRDYNCYVFDYEPIGGKTDESLVPGVKLEVVLGSAAFPTVRLPVDSYVYQYLSEDNMDIAEEYGLLPFEMTVQSLERTFTDKVFAICDYYLEGKIKRHSRHIYDLYMLYPMIKFDENYRRLVSEIRKLRADMGICPSAAPEADINQILQKIIGENIYRRDYINITEYFQNRPVDYDTVIGVLTKIINSGLF